MATDSTAPGINPAADDAPLTPLEQAAANWLIARDRGLTPARKSELDAWLAADSRHAAMFAEMETTWAELDRIDELAEPAPRVVHITAGRQRASTWGTLLGLGLAAAAVVAVLVAPRPRTHHPRPAAVYALNAATEIGGTRSLSLPDGSQITLNTDSALSVRFTQAERRIELARGEAYFHVAKDATRPFFVTADHVVVRAVGTQFDVRVQPTQVVVVVTEGKVRLSDAARGGSLLPGADTEAPVLAAGERAVVAVSREGTPAATKAAAFANDEQQQALAWQSGRVEFVDAPLATIVDEFNRYNRHKLVIGDAALADRHFGGTFGTGDYDAFVRVLENEFGFVAERRESETVLFLRR